MCSKPILKKLEQLQLTDNSIQQAANYIQQQQLTFIKKFNLGSSTKIKVDGNEELVVIDYADLIEEKLIGSGGFGVVKRMMHKPTGRLFAVKILHESLIESSERKSSDLEASIRIGNSSPYLIQFFGAMCVDSHIWLLNELMDTSLDKFCAKAGQLKLALPDVFFAQVAYSTLNALLHMRNLKLIHRDIKPSNILLNADGRVKLCDFGISCFTNNSICDSFKGCEFYTSPEKIRITEKGYSIKSDIWSLGISLIEIATGTHPYIHFTGPLDLSLHIVEGDPPKLDTAKFSKEFCSFVDQCLTKNVEERPSCDVLLTHPFLNATFLRNNHDQYMKAVRSVMDSMQSSDSNKRTTISTSL